MVNKHNYCTKNKNYTFKHLIFSDKATKSKNVPFCILENEEIQQIQLVK